MDESAIPPKWIRLREITGYTGMSIKYFNLILRPYLTVIPFGTHSVAFDKLELDAVMDQYRKRNGRPPKERGLDLWEEKEAPDYISGGKSGITGKRFMDKSYEEALEQAASRKRRPCSPG